MKKLMLSTLALCCMMAFAADKHGDKERQEDIARHRAMAAAHKALPNVWRQAKRKKFAKRSYKPHAKAWR